AVAGLHHVKDVLLGARLLDGAVHDLLGRAAIFLDGDAGVFLLEGGRNGVERRRGQRGVPHDRALLAGGVLQLLLAVGAGVEGGRGHRRGRLCRRGSGGLGGRATAGGEQERRQERRHD